MEELIFKAITIVGVKARTYLQRNLSDRTVVYQDHDRTEAGREVETARTMAQFRNDLQNTFLRNEDSQEARNDRLYKNLMTFLRMLISADRNMLLDALARHPNTFQFGWNTRSVDFKYFLKTPRT